MRLLLSGVLALEQDALKLNAIHTTSPRYSIALTVGALVYTRPGPSSFSGLFGSIYPEELTQFQTSLVQLRLAIAD